MSSVVFSEGFVESLARLLAANDMKLVQDPAGRKLPEGLWKQREEAARAMLAQPDMQLRVAHLHMEAEHNAWARLVNMLSKQQRQDLANLMAHKCKIRGVIVEGAWGSTPRVIMSNDKPAEGARLSERDYQVHRALLAAALRDMAAQVEQGVVIS